MGIISTLLAGAAIVGVSIALQSGDNTKEKVKNFNEKMNKEIEKKSKKI